MATDLKKFLLIAFSFFPLLVFAQEIEDLIAQSADCIEKENYSCAEEALKAALAKDPANARNGFLLANLGTVQRILGKQQDALLAYHAAVTLTSGEISVLMSRAALFTEIDSIPQALNDYNEVIAKKPDHENALYAAGLIYMNENDTLSAKNYFKKILEINPMSVEGKTGLGMIYKLQRDYPAAEALYTDILRHDPEKDFVYIQRALLYMDMNKNYKALEDVNAYLSKNINDEYAYFLRGQIKLQLWEKKSAYDDFLRAKLLGYDADAVNQMIANCR